MKKEINSRVFMVAIISVLLLVAYNVIVFVIGGFDGHDATYWTSYAFMLVSFLVVAVTGLLLKNTIVEPTDWILHYPFYKYAVIYMGVEIVLSAIFMIIDNSDAWVWAFLLQFITFVVFSILIVSCFMAKSMIQEVTKKVEISTSFIKSLRIEVEMISQTATDGQVKAAFAKLAEAVRYSDPVSNSALSDLENSLASEINDAKMFIACGDNSSAMNCCNKASMLLLERNKRTKMMK